METRYFYNDDIDHLIARIDHVDTTAVQLWYLQDYQNSTRYVLDQTGAIVDSLHYDGYGNIDTGSELDPSMRGDYAWTGRELDIETGLQYNRARWYDGTTGKWISEDPMGFDAGDSNLYRYVNNQPTVATDPSGLDDELDFSWDVRPTVYANGGFLVKTRWAISSSSGNPDNIVGGIIVQMVDYSYSATQLVNGKKVPITPTEYFGKDVIDTSNFPYIEAWQYEPRRIRTREGSIPALFDDMVTSPSFGEAKGKKISERRGS